MEEEGHVRILRKQMDPIWLPLTEDGKLTMEQVKSYNSSVAGLIYKPRTGGYVCLVAYGLCTFELPTHYSPICMIKVVDNMFVPPRGGWPRLLWFCMDKCSLCFHGECC